MTQRLSPVVASIQASLDSVVHLSDSSKSGSAATSHLVGAINRVGAVQMQWFPVACQQHVSGTCSPANAAVKCPMIRQLACAALAKFAH